MPDSVFPFIRTAAYRKATAAELPLYRDVDWDERGFAKLDADHEPVFVTGAPALRGWILRALRTRRYAEEPHTWQYGSELDRLIGMPWQRETRCAEAKRYITECLSVNPYITGVTVDGVAFTGTTLTVSCTVHTVYDDITFDNLNLSEVKAVV